MQSHRLRWRSMGNLVVCSFLACHIALHHPYHHVPLSAQLSVQTAFSKHNLYVACPGIMVEPLFNSFATAAFFEFVIFAIFEMRYLLSIWRARRSASLDPWAVQRELSVLYARFYGALLGGIFVMYYLQKYAVPPS